MIHPVRLVVLSLRVRVRKSMAADAEDAAAGSFDWSFGCDIVRM